MRGRKKLFILGALLSTVLIISVVFSSGVVDVLTFSLGGSPASSAGAPESSSPEVFVNPATTRGDYAPGFQIGDTFQVDVNVTGVTDLFAWQINLTWNTSILSLSNIIAGEFLNRSRPTANTTSYGLGFVINVTDNAEGYTAMGESILGGVAGQDDNGTLVTIEFLIVGCGETNLTIIDVGGTLPSTLLNSTLSTIVPIKSDGYFSNRLISDIRGPGAGNPPDHVVNGWDYGFIGLAFGKTTASPDWDTYKIADTRGPGAGNLPDGVINGWDYGYAGLQFGSTCP